VLPDLKLGHGAKDALCKVIIFTLNRGKCAKHAAYLRGDTCIFPAGDRIYLINLAVPNLCKELNNYRYNDIDGKFKIYVNEKYLF
jgi:hypothetical protein